MGLLKKIYDADLVDIYDQVPKDWTSSIQIATQGIVKKGIITSQYVEEIIKNVQENGPYIVIVPGVAMPHASANSKGVLDTAISFSKFPKKIVFDPNDPEKDAQIFFTLAAKNYQEHLNNISQLSDLLTTDGVIESLEKVESLKDFVKVMNKFDCQNQEV